MIVRTGFDFRNHALTKAVNHIIGRDRRQSLNDAGLF